MTETIFQKHILEEIRVLEHHANVRRFSVERKGGRELYFYVVIETPDHRIELYVYEDEAEYCVDGKKSDVLEKPDFQSSQALEATFVRIVKILVAYQSDLPGPRSSLSIRTLVAAAAIDDCLRQLALRYKGIRYARSVERFHVVWRFDPPAGSDYHFAAAVNGVNIVVSAHRNGGSQEEYFWHESFEKIRGVSQEEKLLSDFVKDLGTVLLNPTRIIQRADRCRHRLRVKRRSWRRFDSGSGRNTVALWVGSFARQPAKSVPLRTGTVLP